MLDIVRQRIFCWTLSGKEYLAGYHPAENIFFSFAGHCPVENILLDIVRQRIFCWISSGRKYFFSFAGHCPVENILLDIVRHRIFCWISSGRKYLILLDIVRQKYCFFFVLYQLSLFRYHSLFPEQVPDLQTIEPSKRHTFCGYHTSVFRG